ncbi:hypothetical protein CYLTODRAFT_397114 [Cylindrobasidium torrendii FP15055 ss-10]|uniref:Fibronectin type-III domain-containing protein n=1 Tax=Cylindrobasidium torrendii FP15055 ss-10 TaxID=1314674 RepID=A0A0D7BB78_9AGAR|nr:hypothetical protein CYLTODRAFT_397114 [Cylindrobasidium torrendii FP15055 ss-10]
MVPSCLSAVTLALMALSSAGKASASFMDQSFFFDYTPASEAISVPVTAQCETIHVQWERSSASGPNPVAPYYLQIYTSAFVFPFVVSAGSGLSFDWQVPFGPGTLYQVCMFDSKGYTGGCQRVYTMIANTTVETPSCANVTFPLGPLDIDAKVSNGPLSQYGWIPECTEISLTPKNGTAPYTLTVAPASHPPYNQTLNTKQEVKWTVELGWASSFFISVVDADFNYWSYGPLHSGQGTDTSCLAPSSSSAGLTAGVGIGGVVLGLLMGVVAAFFYYRRRDKRRGRGHQFLPLATSTSAHSEANPFDINLSSSSSTRYQSVPDRLSYQHSGGYQIEPFLLPGERSRSPSSPASPHPNPMQGEQSGARQPSNHVYVVHHDGGVAPVTVFHDDGTEVVELPPRYRDGEGSGQGDERSEGTQSRSERSGSSPLPPASRPLPSPQIMDRRRPGDNPRKSGLHSQQYS